MERFKEVKGSELKTSASIMIVSVMNHHRVRISMSDHSCERIGNGPVAVRLDSTPKTYGTHTVSYTFCIEGMECI